MSLLRDSTQDTTTLYGRNVRNMQCASCFASKWIHLSHCELKSKRDFKVQTTRVTWFFRPICRFDIRNTFSTFVEITPFIDTIGSKKEGKSGAVVILQTRIFSSLGTRKRFFFPLNKKCFWWLIEKVDQSREVCKLF